MLKKFKFELLGLALIALLASCKSTSNEVRDAAQDALQNPGSAATVQPADPAMDAIPAGPSTTMTFEEMEFDFGTVKEGEKVSHTYKFKNTGKEPLILTNAQGSCGCTVPKWPREPIAPGAESALVVEFDTKGKAGQRTQTVTLTGNTNPPQTLIKLKGVVEGTGNAATTQPAIQVNPVN